MTDKDQTPAPITNEERIRQAMDTEAAARAKQERDEIKAFRPGQIGAAD